MNTQRIVAHCLSLMLTSTALAQSFGTLAIETKRMPFPTDIGISAACAVGDFDGNLIVDAVHLRSGTLTFIHDVGFDGVAVEIPFSASDVATLEDGIGGHDAWLVVGGDGLYLGSWSDAIFESSGSATSGIEMSAIDDDDWKGTTRVVTGDINGDGHLDILGSAPMHGAVLTLLGSDDGFVSGPPIPCNSTPYAIGTFDRDLDGRDQIVVSTQSGPFCYELVDGEYVDVECALPKDAFAQFAAYPQTDGTESLLGLTRASNGVQWVALDRLGGMNSLLAIGEQPEATGIAAADFDLDGRVDFALNSRASGNHFWSVAHATIPTFDLHSDLMNYFLATSDGKGSPNMTRETALVAADLDNDLDPDLLWGDDVTMTSSALINPRLDSNAFKPQLLHFSEPYFDPASTCLNLGFDIAPPAALLPGLTHYELTVWKQATATSAAESVAVAYALDPIDSLTSFSAVAIELPEDSPEFDTVYWLRLRAVALKQSIAVSQPVLSAAGPCSSFMIDLSPLLVEYFDPKSPRNGVPILSGGSIPQPPPGSVMFPNGPPTGGHSTGTGSGGG